jgi:chemotaxis methyl-accepting protein methylase
MSLADDPGFAALRQRLAGHALPPLDMYKDKCLRRRLAVRMRACGVATLSEYAALLGRRPDEVARLLDTLTINVTQFFRNPETWARLRLELVRLAAEPGGGLRAWSAGCATGEEAYTVAILALDVWSERASAGADPQVRIDATDVDPQCLDAARSAQYPAASFREAPRQALERYTRVVGDRREVTEAVRALVRFTRHDLGRDPAPHPPYDLVVCRNVVIYFERRTQERLFGLFADALRPAGLLLLGKVETLYGPARDRFEPLDARERLYRRVA